MIENHAVFCKSDSAEGNTYKAYDCIVLSIGYRVDFLKEYWTCKIEIIFIWSTIYCLKFPAHEFLKSETKIGQNLIGIAFIKSFLGRMKQKEICKSCRPGRSEAL